MSKWVKGSCACGQSTFQVNGEPKFTINCYCIDCRKLGGQTGQMYSIVKPEQFKLGNQDTMMVWTSSKTESGRPKHMTLCKTCGSVILCVFECDEGRQVSFSPCNLDSDWDLFVPDQVGFEKDIPEVYKLSKLAPSAVR